jgi:glycosyltransferase involved in cell wall biosynthesis
MKVLFSAQSNINATLGGPDVWVLNLVKYLIKNDIDARIVFFHFGEYSKCKNIIEATKLEIPFFLIEQHYLKSTEKNIKSIFKVIEEFRPNAFVANLNIPSLFASKYLNKFNITTIGVLHGSDEFYEGVIEEFIWKNSLFRVAHFVAVSDYLVKLANSKTHKSKVHKIPCGPSVPEVINKRTDKTLNLVFIGRFHNGNKQIIEVTKALCYAVSNIDNVKAFMYGDGPELENVKSIIKENNCTSKVILKGFINNEELYSELEDKDIIVLMSKSEGMPIALMEGMGAGLIPVCKSLEKGINEIIDHKINGYLFDGTMQSFARIIKYLADNRIIREQLSLNARKKVLSNYSSTITNKKWLDLLLGLNKVKLRENGLDKLHLQKIKLPMKNKKINEDRRAPKPPSFFARLRKSVGLRTRIKKVMRF